MLSFTDVEGNAGVITDDLEVEYSGRWRAEIEHLVDELTADLEADGARGAREEYGLLIAELPDEAPIVEIERVADGGDGTDTAERGDGGDGVDGTDR